MTVSVEFPDCAPNIAASDVTSELLKSPRQIWRPGKLSWAATLLCSQSWLQAGFPARPAA
jgi:hypothetical protein